MKIKKKFFMMLFIVSLLFSMTNISSAGMGGWATEFGYNGTTGWFRCKNITWSGTPNNFKIVMKQYVLDACGNFKEYPASGIDYKYSDINKYYMVHWQLPFVPVTGVMAFRISCYMDGKLVYYSEWGIKNGQCFLMKERQ